MIENSYDSIIVLGYDVNREGIMPLESKNRVEKALELISKGQASKVIFCGKVSYTHHFIPKRTEARAMAHYAIEIGIPKSDVIIEEESRTTYQNALFSKRIVDKSNWKRLVIISGKFHLKRSAYTFRHVYGTSYDLDFVASENGLPWWTLKYKQIINTERFVKAIVMAHKDNLTAH